MQKGLQNSPACAYASASLREVRKPKPGEGGMEVNSLSWHLKPVRDDPPVPSVWPLLLCTSQICVQPKTSVLCSQITLASPVESSCIFPWASSLVCPSSCRGSFLWGLLPLPHFFCQRELTSDFRPVADIVSANMYSHIQSSFPPDYPEDHTS